jgi:hypothetical protein
LNRWDYDDDDWKCRRLDEQNLIDKFLKKSEEVPEFKDKVGKVVENREELLAIDTSSVDYLLGRSSKQTDREANKSGSNK